jgi:hypothetical protein
MTFHSAPIRLSVIPAKAGIQLSMRAKHTLLVLSASHDVFHWMIRFAHPSGAVLRTFCALRAGPAFAGMTSTRISAEDGL